MFEKGSFSGWKSDAGRNLLDIRHTTTWLELRLSMSLNLWVLFRFQRCLDVAKPLDLRWERGHHEAYLAFARYRPDVKA